MSILVRENAVPLLPAAEAVIVDRAWLGDLLVAFGSTATPPARRPDAPFDARDAGDAWQVWEAPVAADWNGAPVMRLDAGGWVAWLVGELYDAPRPEAIVLALLGGAASPNDLNGHFLLLAHEVAANEWHVWTNRHATFHAYYASDGCRAAVGTSFRAVAGSAARPDLDWEALTSFFAFGYFAGDRTHLLDARILRPASHYRFDSRGRLLEESCYWRWWHAPNPGRSFDATLDEFADRFQVVMDEAMAGGRIAVPISGGLDSRSTVATVRRDSPTGHIWAYSYGYGDDSPETRIAARVAAARGLDFEAVTIRPYLFERLPRVAGSIEGFQELTQSRQAAVADAIGARSDFLIAAHWGDVYHDDMGVARAPQPDDPVAVAMYKFRKAGSAWLLDTLSRPRLAADPEEVLRAQVADELRRVGPLDDPDFVIKALKTDQWSARWTTASLRMFQAAAFPRLPFYDTRLADFFCTVPTDFVSRRRMQIEYLKRRAPDLARIPWQVTGRDLFSRGFDPRPLARRAVRKGRVRLSGTPVIERNWEIQYLWDGGRAALNRWLLRPGRRLHEHVEVEAVRRLLNDFYRDPWADKRSYAVSLLLTLSVWLDYMAGDLDE